MKILILGSGVIGTTLAYVLARRGYEVTVLDRQPESGRECSFANGGQLSYSHAEPWASPHVIPNLLRWIGRKDAPLVFRMRYDPDMWRWGLQFLRHCTATRNEAGTRAMLRLALYARESFRELEQQTDTAFDYLDKGILHIYRDQKSLDAALHHAAFQAELGCPFELLTREQTLAKEPAFKQSGELLAGSVFFPFDGTGDIFSFTQGLAKECQTMDNVTFSYNTAIEAIMTEGDRITGVKTNHGLLTADRYVMALGADSALWLKTLDIPVPIYPVKGYSISVPIENDEAAPRLGITDQALKIVYSRLGNRLRVAGTAELNGYNYDVRDDRIAPLVRATQIFFPHCGNLAEITRWACLRPYVPDGMPVLGHTPYRNLVLNTGHGSLGWTLAAGSAYIVADMIEGKAPGIDLAGLTIDRFY